MTSKPDGNDASKGTSNPAAKPAVKIDTLSQVPNDDKVMGGRAPRTDNPSKVDAYCCGE